MRSERGPRTLLRSCSGVRCCMGRDEHRGGGAPDRGDAADLLPLWSVLPLQAAIDLSGRRNNLLQRFEYRDGTRWGGPADEVDREGDGWGMGVGVMVVTEGSRI